MKLFFIGWGDHFPELADVVEGIQKRGHDILYWVRSDDVFRVDRSRFPGTIFHDAEDALHGRPAEGVPADIAEPVGAPLIAQFAETETIVLTMMNKKFEGMSLPERKHHYYHLLSYWRGVVSRYKPDAIIFCATPHTVYDYVLFAIARAQGIPTSIFEAVWVADRVVAMSDFRSGPLGIPDALQRLKGRKVGAAELPPDLAAYYREQTSREAKPTPQYVTNILSSFSGVRLLALRMRVVLRSIANGSILRNAFNFVARRLGNNLKKEYERLASPPDFTKPYVYLPLHVQPERTTSPQGGAFVDQLLMVELLSAALPAGWRIYVKEHPTQWKVRGTAFFYHRYRTYYRHMARFNNVRFVPIGTDTFALMNHAKAVATATGTAGWEGILRGKPAFAFGYPWYMHAPGVFRVEDAGAVRAAFGQIQAGVSPSGEDVLRYLAALGEVSFPAYLEPYGRTVSRLTPEENTAHIIAALRRAIPGL